MNSELLWVFMPTVAAISLSRGICITLTPTLAL